MLRERKRVKLLCDSYGGCAKCADLGEGSPDMLLAVDSNGNIVDGSSLVEKCGGTNYICVTAKGTPTENGVELNEAYTKAKTMSPGEFNKITLLLYPGYYGLNAVFYLDTEWIDVTSITGNRDVVLDRLDETGDPFDFGTSKNTRCLNISTNNIRIAGLEGALRQSPSWGAFPFNASGYDDYVLPIQTDGNYTGLRVKNCKGGITSFGGSFVPSIKEVSGTYIDCIGGAASFGGNAVASGEFIGCTGDIASFGGGDSGVASGKFSECTAGDFTFGGDTGNASGDFTNCTGGEGSFASNGDASGNFRLCRGGDGSFGANSVASGVFKDCRGGIGSFGGNGGGALTGELYGCKLTAGTYKTVSGGGRTYYCVDGNGGLNNQ